MSYEYLSNYPRHFFAAEIVASAERGEPQADRVDWQLDLYTKGESPPSPGISDARLNLFIDHFFQAANGSYIPMCCIKFIKML